MKIDRETADKYQGLFNYLNEQYGLNLTIDDMNDLIAEVDKTRQLLIPRVSNWVAVKECKPDNCDQVFVKYENGRYGINEWWESDNCWKYEFDNMIVKEWCKPPCY